MHDAHELLRTLAVVLSAAAVTTVVFQRLKQPVVFGYLLAGMIVSPHVPIPLMATRPPYGRWPRRGDSSPPRVKAVPPHPPTARD